MTSKQPPQHPHQRCPAEDDEGQRPAWRSCRRGCYRCKQHRPSRRSASCLLMRLLCRLPGAGCCAACSALTCRVAGASQITRGCWVLLLHTAAGAADALLDAGITQRACGVTCCCPKRTSMCITIGCVRTAGPMQEGDEHHHPASAYQPLGPGRTLCDVCNWIIPGSTADNLTRATTTMHRLIINSGHDLLRQTS